MSGTMWPLDNIEITYPYKPIRRPAQKLTDKVSSVLPLPGRVIPLIWTAVECLGNGHVSSLLPLAVPQNS